MDPTIQRMLAFSYVGELGSFTKAAIALGLSKSSMSQHISGLEKSLSVKLINRTTNKLELTDAGKSYLKRCLEIRRIYYTANSEVIQNATSLRGGLRITLPYALVETLVMPAIAEFLLQNPLITPEFIIDDLRREVIREYIDLAISVGELPDSELHYIHIGYLDEVLCASPKYLINNNIDSINDLANAKYIGNRWENSNASKILCRGDIKKEVSIGPPSAISNNVFSIRAMTIEGLGIACLPVSVVTEAFESGKLVKILPEYTLPRSKISAVHAYGKFLPKRIDEYVNFLKSYAQNTIMFRD